VVETTIGATTEGATTAEGVITAEGATTTEGEGIVVGAVTITAIHPRIRRGGGEAITTRRGIATVNGTKIVRRIIMNGTGAQVNIEGKTMGVGGVLSKNLISPIRDGVRTPGKPEIGLGVWTRGRNEMGVGVE